MEKTLIVNYRSYDSLYEMDAEDKALVEAAVEAISGSYAPYSDFHVGAAVRLSDGTVVTGANQENAAFPSGLCAERTAMFCAGARYPELAQVSLAIASKGPDGKLTDSLPSPCGACRQVMAEYQKKGGTNMSIILHSARQTLKFERVDDILPFIFDAI